MTSQTRPSQPQPAKQYAGSRCVTLDYASVRNLAQPVEQEKDPFKVKLLPGLGVKKRGSMRKQKDEEEPELMEEPRLLTTAKAHIQEHHSDIQSETEMSNFLGLSSFLNSREVTPNNPLTGTLHRKRNAPSQKNKLNSISSELFDIQSNPEEQVDRISSKFKNRDFRLHECIIGQSEVVYQHVFGRERTINPKLIHLWKDCLSHEDKSEIYLPVSDTHKVDIPYSNCRIYAINEIEKGFKEIYGVGKQRSLKIGEEAIILDGINRYLNICSKDVLKISRKDFDIIENILSDCKLQEMENFPYCMKQVETHFKLMATKWKYSGKLDHSDRIVESALIMGKNNFLDLNKTNILTGYLLRNSNLAEL